MSVKCPTCNTSFPEDVAPWLKQVEYCPKHDRVFLAGTQCEFCTPAEREQIQTASDKAHSDVANTEREARGEPAVTEIAVSGSRAVGG